MIRKSTHTLKFANQGKIALYWKIMRDYKELLQYYIDLMHEGVLPVELTLSNTKLPVINDIVHSKWLCLCYREASQIYRSCCEKKKFSKPVVEHHSININPFLWDIQEDTTKEFDCYIKLRCPYLRNAKRAITLKIPIKFHRHSNKFRENGWKLNTSTFMLRDNFSIDLFWEKNEAEKKETGKAVGVDCGYKKLLACSDGQIYRRELESIYAKIARKKRGSKAYKRALRERDNLTNRTTNTFVREHKDCDTIVCENLKKVKNKSKFSKKFNNKLQYWSYHRTLDKLEQLSETEGFRLIKVRPEYTSQRCHRCKFVIKENRQGEHYHCANCGEEIDADINAAINILQLGV